MEEAEPQWSSNCCHCSLTKSIRLPSRSPFPPLMSIAIDAVSLPHCERSHSFIHSFLAEALWMKDLRGKCD